MPLITQVADAVATLLGAMTLSQPVTIVRGYLPRAELADLKTLRVTVVPSTLAVASASRGQVQRDVSVDIAVQQKVTAETNDTLDPLLALAEEIAEQFRGIRLAAFPQAAWIRTEFKPIYAPEHIEQLRAFTSVLTLTFRVID